MKVVARERLTCWIVVAPYVRHRRMTGSHGFPPLVETFHEPAGYFPDLDLVIKSPAGIEREHPSQRFRRQASDHPRHTKVAAGNAPNRLGARKSSPTAAGVIPECKEVFSRELKLLHGMINNRRGLVPQTFSRGPQTPRELHLFASQKFVA